MYDEPDDLDELQPSPQAKGSVKVNASLIEYDAEKMFDSIARIAAHQIVEQSCGDIRKAVQDEVRATIQSRVGAIIEKAVNEPIQQHNHYGEKAGEPTTLKALIGKTAEGYLGAKSMRAARLATTPTRAAWNTSSRRTSSLSLITRCSKKSRKRLRPQLLPRR